MASYLLLQNGTDKLLLQSGSGDLLLQASAGSSGAVSPTSATINQLATQTITPSGFTGTAVTWSSSNTGIATVNSSGVVTGVAHAQATNQAVNITATGIADPSETAVAVITVRAVAVAVSPTSATINDSATQQITPTVTGTSGSTSVTWSLVSGLGSVDASGLYTAPTAAPTTAVVRATSVADTGRSADSTITVVRVTASTYYIASGGSDSANGQTTGTPWQTISKVTGWSKVAGDQYLFNGGDTFTGNLHCTASGTAGAPIIFGKYGSGAPTISCGDSYGVWLDECAYVYVQDLTITGSGVSSGGVTTSIGDGVLATLAGSADLAGIVVTRCTITGVFYGVRLSVAASNAHSFLRPIVAYNTIHDCGFTGVFLTNQPVATGSHVQRITNPAVIGNTIYNIYGVTGTAAAAQGDYDNTIWSGFGIMCQCVSGGLVSQNLVHDCGAASTGTNGGPTGILAVECNALVIRANEVYNQFAPDGLDGEGIDLDGGSVNCIVEGNWVHETDGPAFFDYNIGGAFTQNSGNIFRWNITQNCGRRTKHAGLSNHATFIALVSSINTSVYNNTDYSAKATGTETKTIDDQSTSGAIFRNNNFSIIGSGATFGSVKNGSLLQGNNYDASGGASFSIDYNSVTKTSLSALRAVAETVGSVSIGSTTSPAFANAGGGAAVAVGTIRQNVSAYDSTALASSGLDLLTVFATDPGGSDFHGGAVRTSAGYPVGAVAASYPSNGNVVGMTGANMRGGFNN